MSEDLSELYQEIILGHNKRPRNERSLEPCDYTAEGFNPLCGDRVSVFARKGESGLITEVSFIGEGCAISRASASIMTVELAGKSLSEIEDRIEKITGMLSQSADEEWDLAEVGDLAALAGVRKFPARIKCATLAWHALKSAINQRS